MVRPTGSEPKDEVPVPSDRSLLRRLRAGSDDAATQLYLRYARRLQALARANASRDLAAVFDPDDVVQSVFRTFFRRAAQGHYDVPDGEDLWKLLLVMGLNKIRSVGAFHRAAKRDVRALGGSDALAMALARSDDSDESSLVLLRMVIDEVLEGLTPVHRQILNMRIEGHEVAAIAEQVGRSKRSVERILQGVLKSLSESLRESE